jgi:putative oxidoreductase
VATKIAILILRFGFGGLFFYSGITKIRDPILFLESVRGFRIFDHLSALSGFEIDPSPWEAWIAMGLPWLEVFCGACVLLGVFDRGALAILCGALFTFALAITSAWVRGLDISCGCFGESTPVSDYRITILQRLGFLAVGITLLIFTLRETSSKTPAADA